MGNQSVFYTLLQYCQSQDQFNHAFLATFQCLVPLGRDILSHLKTILQLVMKILVSEVPWGIIKKADSVVWDCLPNKIQLKPGGSYE